LASDADPWPEDYGAKAGYEFRGYRVGKDGVPVFLYEVKGLSVEDVMRPGANGKSMHRTLTITAKKSDDEANRSWKFLGLSKDAKPVPVPWKGDSAVIEEEVKP
jgi:hypothetical protein